MPNPRSPDSPARPEPDAPAVRVRLRCPACGRESAIVFTASTAADGKPLPRPREVCLACCPNAPGDS